MHEQLLREILVVLEDYSVGRVVTYSNRLLPFIPRIKAALSPAAPVAEDICGFCGKPGADKIPHPVRWPGENSAGTELVHAACKDMESHRAHDNLSHVDRMKFLHSL